MAKLRQSIIHLAAILLAAQAALCPTSAYAYAPEIGGGSLRWNAIDLVGVAREDTQILVNQQPVLRDGRRFVFALPLREGSSAHVTNLTVLARVSDDDEEWVAQQSVTLRVPACPEEIGTTLSGATVSDSLTEYLFDARNRLRRATDKIGEPRLQALYDYYADDRRARKVVSVWTNDAWQVSHTNQFIYNEWNLVREVVTDGGTVTTRDYTWGLDLAGLQSGTWSQEAGGIGGLLAITEVTGSSTNILLPICDHVGTIHALVAAMTNSVALSEPIIVETRTYSPYGELIEVDAPLLTTHHSPLTSPCPFGFQSKYYDPETGFWYYGYRYYDAKSAKWLTADPLQEAGGLNLTAFCGGDPVNQIDPLGLEIGVVPSGRAWQSLLVTYEDAGPYYYGTELWEAPIAGFANIATFTANTTAGTVAALFELLEVNVNDSGAEFAAVFPAAPIVSIAMAEHGGGMLASRTWRAIATTRAGTKVGNLASSAREWSARSIGRIFGNNAAITGNPGAVQLPTRPSIAAKTTPSLDALSQAAGAADRGSLTVAGRSLTKHGAGARAGNTIFPAGKGNPLTINQIAQDIVDDILTAPGSTIQGSTRGRFGPTLEVTAPNGQGIVYGANGKFLFFKE